GHLLPAYAGLAAGGPSSSSGYGLRCRWGISDTNQARAFSSYPPTARRSAPLPHLLVLFGSADREWTKRLRNRDLPGRLRRKVAGPVIAPDIRLLLPGFC